VLTMERQTPDLPLGIAIVAHTVIVAGVIWSSAIALPDDSVRMDHPNEAESTIDIIMLADQMGGAVRAAASVIEEKPLPKAPEFRIPDLADGDVLQFRQVGTQADAEDDMWAIPAAPERDTMPRVLDLHELADAPRFMAVSRAPSLRNPDHIQRYLNEHFPVALRRAGGEVLVVVWLLVDTQGKVFRAVVPETSGRYDTDSLAVTASYLMEFDPAEQGGGPVPVWVQQPVRFRVQDFF
jgi:TonB family protein